MVLRSRAYACGRFLHPFHAHTEVPKRLDQYLKVSRIIKRRTVANEACSGGRVTLNGKGVKPGAEVHGGDQMTIRFGDRYGRYEILSVAETVRKEGAADMYRVLSEDEGVSAQRS